MDTHVLRVTYFIDDEHVQPWCDDIRAFLSAAARLKIRDAILRRGALVRDDRRECRPLSRAALPRPNDMSGRHDQWRGNRLAAGDLPFVSRSAARLGRGNNFTLCGRACDPGDAAQTRRNRSSECPAQLDHAHIDHDGDRRTKS